MAKTATPIFIQTGASDPVTITAAITAVAAGTGATDVCTGGTDDSRIDGIQFISAGPCNRGLILIYHDEGSGTKKLIGHLRTETSAFSVDEPPWTAIWTNPNKGPLKASDKFCAGLYGMSGTFHAWALGGNY